MFRYCHFGGEVCPIRKSQLKIDRKAVYERWKNELKKKRMRLAPLQAGLIRNFRHVTPHYPADVAVGKYRVKMQKTSLKLCPTQSNRLRTRLFEKGLGAILLVKQDIAGSESEHKCERSGYAESLV